MFLLIKRLIAMLISLLNIFSIMNIGRANKLVFIRDFAFDYVQSADVSVNVRPAKEYQTITGFGTSACWWAQDIGKTENAEEVARLLYSDEGLALNIYRYNLGGGEKDNPNSRISGNRATESFYYLNEATGQYEYDFTRDAAAQRILDLSLSFGNIDTVVLFANSPHYSMTRTGHATGGLTENFSNLPPENYQAFADYFITITRYFLEKGVPVKYISPINEPQWSWGGGWVGQEGCHYEPDEIVAVMKVFAKAIKESGLDIKLMAPESGEIGDTTINWFDRLVAEPEVAEVLGSLAYHSYWADGQAHQKYQFGQKLAEKNYPVNVDMTEWCELPLEHDISDFAGAVRTASVISQDLLLSGANSWTAWVGVNNIGYKEDGTKWSDGLIAMNDDGSEIEVAARYCALAHFSKFIPAGSVRVDAGADILAVDFQKDEDRVVYAAQLGFSVSAYKTPDQKIVVVAVNESNTRNFTVTSFGKLRADIYQSTEEYRMKEISSGLIPVKTAVPANSITTFVLY